MKYGAIGMPLSARFGVHLPENTMVAIIGTMSHCGLCKHVQMFAIKLSSRHFSRTHLTLCLTSLPDALQTRSYFGFLSRTVLAGKAVPAVIS
jgi:hypothetical protein